MTRTLPLAAVGAALLLAGCGGSSGSSSSSSSSFVASANKICAATGAQIEALPAAGNTTTSIAIALGGEIPLITSELSQLKALKPPSSDASDWSSTLSDLAQGSALLPQIEAAAKANNAAQVQALGSQIKPSSDKATALATKLGLTQCAADYEPGSSSSSSSTSS